MKSTAWQIGGFGEEERGCACFEVDGCGKAFERLDVVC